MLTIVWVQETFQRLQNQEKEYCKKKLGQLKETGYIDNQKL